MTPRTVILDVETAPLEVYSWGLWRQNIGLNQIVCEWSLLSFAVKELGKREVIYHDNRDADDPRDDYDLLVELWLVLDDADIVITQNGVKFDMKKINARLAMEGFPPPSPVRVIDTLVEARRAFGFTSNKLEWLANNLTGEKKSQHRRFPGFELWKECLAGNPLAWNEMKKYNVQDVIATEEVYLKLRPWIRHPNMAVYSEAEGPICPKCGSDDVQSRGNQATNSGVYQRMRCSTCAGWSRIRKRESGKVLLT